MLLSLTSLHLFFLLFVVFFFNHAATTEIYTLSLHDALPIWQRRRQPGAGIGGRDRFVRDCGGRAGERAVYRVDGPRSEEHTSELQSLRHLVCRLLLEKKKKNK